MGLSRQEYWNGLPFPTSGYISKEKDIIISKKRSEVKSLSRIQLFVTPWTVAYNAPPFMGLSRQEYWSGLPCPFPEDLTHPGIKPRSPALQADSLPSEPPGKSFLDGMNQKSQAYLYIQPCFTLQFLIS